MNRKHILFFILLSVFLAFCAGAYGETADSSDYIRLSKTYITVKNGESVSVPVEASASVRAVSEDTSICSFYWGSNTSEANNYNLMIEGKGVGVSTIKVYIRNNPDIFTEIRVSVAMTDEEKKNANAVRYISDREFFYYDAEDVYVFLFALKDENETRIAAPATVDIRIENDKGETVYNKTRYVPSSAFSKWTYSNGNERYLGSVRIKPEDILPGESETGTFYYTVRQPYYFSFSEYKLSAKKLPKIDIVKMSSLTVPEMPMTLSYTSSSGKIYTTVELTALTYEFAEYNLEKREVHLTIDYTGQKTYDNVSDIRNAECRFYWKLYDAEGYIVATGTSRTSAIATGEKFKNGQIDIYSLPAGAYTIKFFDSVG